MLAKSVFFFFFFHFDSVGGRFFLLSCLFLGDKKSSRGQ